jgi:hypothetical protein
MPQLNDIEPAFTRLVLAHERLGLIEALGDLYLGQSRLTSKFSEKRAEALVLRRVDRLVHVASGQ